MQKLERLARLESYDLNEFGLTNRDMELLRLMAYFGGKTYLPVLEKTMFYGTATQTIRNKIQKLRTKKKLVKTRPTGLVKPRTAYVFTGAGRDFALDVFGKKINEIKVTPTTLNHNILEQITFFYLYVLGRDVERSTVAEWREKGLAHAPDLYYTNKKGKMVYVEIENTLKRPQRHIDIFRRVEQDDVGAVLYVFENEQKMRTLGQKLPIWDKVKVTTIEWLIDGVRNEGKLKAITQDEMWDIIRRYKKERRDKRLKNIEPTHFEIREEV